ncbi:MAG: glutathione peroxidase [Aestuariivita sp.]|nr:glutathione peroxidase [Aestuariivita sp.]
MKQFILTIIGVFMVTTQASADQTAYDFSFDALMAEKPIKISNYRENVILVVNTASKCGFTGQYKGLEALYQRYRDDGLVIIGVPSNDFGQQEPGSNEEIANFCKINYGVTFPITSKYSIKGDNAHPFYEYARKKLGFDTAPKWNFHKYLINRQGMLVNYFHSATKPDSDRLVKAITSLLKEDQ